MVSFLRAGAVALVLLLALVPVPTHAADGDITVSAVSETTFATGASGTDHSLTFTVTNNDDTVTVDEIRVSVPAASAEKISFAGGTASGWTGVASNTNSAGNDLVTFTGGTLAPAGTVDVTVTFDVTTTTDADTVAVTVNGLDDSTSLDTDAFTLTFKTPTVTLSKTAITLDEDPDTADTDTFTVVLSGAPASDVVLAVTSGSTSVATVDKSSLTFTRTNWDTPQTVTVTAVDDTADNPSDRTTTVTVSVTDASSDNAYDDVANQVVSVTLDDDDPGLTFSPTATTIVEGGTAQTLAVTLSEAPTGTTVKLDITTATGAPITVDKASMTFTSTNWDTAQQLVITAPDNSNVATAAATTDITFDVASGTDASEYSALPDITHTVTVLDDDGLGITLSSDGLQVSEASTTGASFTVQLAKKPSAEVTLAVAVNDAASTGTSADVSLSKSTLTFSTTNWNTAQTVTATAVNDAIVEGSEAVAITMTASGASEYLGSSAVVTATIADNDDPGLVVTESGDDTRTSEDGRTDSFTVKLERQPAGGVVVGLTAGQLGEVQLSKTRVAFTTTNWATAQTVTLTGIDDSARDGHQEFDITLSIVAAESHAAWHDLDATNVTVTNLDDEATLMVRPENIDLKEGDSADYTLALTLQPTSDVEVELDLPSGLTANLAKVVFTPNNWDEERTITVTAVDDSRKNGDRDLEIEHDIDSSDNRYAVADPLLVRVEDDDPFDIARANRDLQDSLKVERDGDDNVLTWDIGEVDGDPAGVQIWRSQSPFKLLDNLDNSTSEFDDEEFRDSGDKGAFYIITVYYAETEERGFFTSADDLTDVPGYEDKDDDELEDLAGSSGSDSNTAVIVGSIVGTLLLIGLIILIIVLVRRKKGGDDDEWDDEPATEQGDSWDWDDFSSRPKEAPAQAPPAQDESWAAEEQDSWDEPAEWDQPASKEWPQHEARAPARAPAPAPWPEDKPAKPAGGETFHLTCPQCRHDFSAHGRKPLVTECPNCHVEGVLR